MPPPRHLLIAAIAAAALAAPAPAPSSAADVTYDANAFTFVEGTATGSDGEGWTSSSSFYTEIDQMITGIPATDDQDSVVGTATGNRIFSTTLKQDYALDTALGAIAWNCVQAGPATGAPGSLTLTRQGQYFDAQLAVAQSLTQSRNCTGYSSFNQPIEIAPGPVFTEWTFPASQFEKDGVASHTVDEVVPCGEWTIFQTACTLRLRGSVSITRRGTKPPAGDKPIKQVTGKLLDGNRRAKVKVTCRAACDGTITATAVARRRLKAKKVAEKPFRNRSAAPREVEIMLGPRGSRTVRSRGAVIVDVRSGAQKRSVRLEAR